MFDVSDLGFRYGDEWIFRHLSFSITRGSVVAILGPNGRGKTTLVKTLTALQRPTEGRVSVNGSIGYVPQSVGTAFAYRVIDMVVMGRTRHISLFGTPSREDFERAHRLLDELGLANFGERPFDTLSGGERQLVLIARALCSDCDVLVLDEPASALDFKNQDTVLRTLRRLSREKGLTIVLTTHFPQHALYLADEALLMFGIEKYKFGPAADLLTDGHLSLLYGLPIQTLKVGDGQTPTAVPIFGGAK